MEIREGLGGTARVVFEEGRKRPLAMIKLLLRKVARSWYATDSQRFENIIMALQAPFLLVFVLGGLVAGQRGPEPRMLAQGAWILVFYFWCMCAITLPLLRYMVPAVGLLSVLVPEMLQVGHITRRPWTRR